VVSGPVHGTLAWSNTGSFTYTPNRGFLGTDTFTYQVSDGLATSNAATVTLQVVDTPPIVRDDYYQMQSGRPFSSQGSSDLSSVLGAAINPMGQALTAQVVSGPRHGNLNLNSDGTFTYVPAAGFVGVDSFTFDATDGTDTSNVATATLNVTNNAPVATPASYFVPPSPSSPYPYLNTFWGGSVLANDYDPDGDQLTAQLVTTTQNGSLTLNPNGTFTYTPVEAFLGVDSFTYQASDGEASSSTTTVTLNVTNPTLIAVNDSYTLNPTTFNPWNNSIGGNVQSNDYLAGGGMVSSQCR
jgi:VCBS repeat-containing protein